MSRDKSLDELRRHYTVGELMQSEHDRAPREAIQTPIVRTSFMGTARPENTHVETHPEMSVKQMVSEGLISRGELMTGGTPKIRCPQ